MVNTKRSRKQVGGEQLVATIYHQAPLKEIIEDFIVYNQHLQEECYLVFQQLYATGVFLASPSVNGYIEEFKDDTFVNVKEAYDEFMNSIETDNEFVMSTIFDEIETNQVTNVTQEAENAVLGGGRDFGIDLSNITKDTVGTYSTKILLSVIKRYENVYYDLTPEQQEVLVSCITEYQIKAMTSLSKLYLGDVGISCMLFNAFLNMGEVIRKTELTGGDVASWIRQSINASKTLARQSVDITKQTVFDLGAKIEKGATAIAKAAHKDISSMPLEKKFNILQNLSADLVKWAGKQIMLRMRTPEFDISSVSDMSSFKDEVLKFIENRISQIMKKSHEFDETKQSRKQKLLWILSILENLDSLLSLIKTMSQISLPDTDVDIGIKINMSASLDTGLKVKLEPSEWLKEISGSVDSLKSLVEERQSMLDEIINIKISTIIQKGQENKKARELDRQLQLLDIAIYKKTTILQKSPDNNLIRLEIGRLQTLRENLMKSKQKQTIEIEETCIQLLQEIHSYVIQLQIPNVPLDIVNKRIMKELANKVDFTAFDSIADKIRNTNDDIQSTAYNTMNNVKTAVSPIVKSAISQISKFDIGLTTYFNCIGKYLQYCPNISNIMDYIGFLNIDLSNAINKIGGLAGTVATGVSDIASGATAYLQIVNVALLIIHLIVAGTLNARNKTLNKERVTLADIRKSSEERTKGQNEILSPEKRTELPKLGGKARKRVLRGGMSLPPIMQSQDRLMKMRRVVDKNSSLPLFIVKGTQSVLNQRVKEHSMTLLEPRFTRDEILKPFLSKTVNSSSLLAKNLISNVDGYMTANALSLDNNSSVLANLKKQGEFIKLNIKENETYPLKTCNTLPSQLTVEEDVYVLSMFAKFQGEQLRNAFRMTPVLKPTDDSLYCSITDKMELYEPRLTKIVASIVKNFNGNDNTLIGGSKRKLRTNEKKQIRSYLQTKTTKQLYTYTQLKNIHVSSKMSKEELIDTIINTMNKQ